MTDAELSEAARKRRLRDLRFSGDSLRRDVPRTAPATGLSIPNP